ncbi:MAG: hypothetical protein IT318_04815 [Anaerolineales bacterium]|nr:hypothetical protein [Anaerolineales bacterium]
MAAIYPSDVPWEQQVLRAWPELDPLAPFRLPGEAARGYDPEALAAAWRVLAPRLRAQAWREREIAQYLFQNLRDWAARMPALEGLGVARRPLALLSPLEQIEWTGGSPTQALRHLREVSRRFAADEPRDTALMGVLFFQGEPPGGDQLAAAGAGPFIGLDSPVLPLESLGHASVVPLVAETSQPFGLLGGGPAPAGAAAAIVLQSGLPIEGHHASGYANPGTLTAIADADLGGPRREAVLVSAQHVIGDPNNPVTHTGQRIAEVVESDSGLDAAIARLDDPTLVDKHISGLGLAPAAPVLPTTGLPVQFSGGASGVQYGQHVDVVYRTAPWQYSVGAGSCFEAQAYAQPGDSGALLLTGHGAQSPIDPVLAAQNPALASQYTAAMLGLLLAGPQLPPAPGTTARIIARPIVDVGSRFKLAWRLGP